MDNKKHLRCWAEIDLNAIRHNISKLKEHIPEVCSLMAVVKGEGYGHGMIPVATACAEAGADWFGVATIDEALALRENGTQQPILVLGVTPAERAEELAKNHISQLVPSLEYARELAHHLNPTDLLPIHAAVDTGMGRLGWWLTQETMAEVCREIQQIHNLPSLHLEGLMTQLASGRGQDPNSLEFSKHQAELFLAMCTNLEKANIVPKYKHILNSGGIMNHTEYALDIVRIGHLLYDNLPGAEPFGLLPALEMKATISFIKELPAGASVGYGRSYRLTKPARIAVVNIGYSDGYPECFSNKGYMALHGKLVPVVGSVCMDQTMIDVTDVPDAAVGDIVTIVGRDGNITLTMQDVARQVDWVLSDPISVNITTRMPRFYL